jgi:hypothetical protein
MNAKADPATPVSVTATAVDDLPAKQLIARIKNPLMRQVSANTNIHSSFLSPSLSLSQIALGIGRFTSSILLSLPSCVSTGGD